jgi:hypothetical protein
MHNGRMGQTSNERLRDYLAQLPPQSQALLMREFERAIERGEDTSVANFVLEQLRKVARRVEEDDPLQIQPNAAIRFCEALFGAEYASLMTRAAEHAVTGDRQLSGAERK